MINFPVTFQRDFKFDFPISCEIANDLLEKCQRVALAVLPLVGTIRALRNPLSLGMGCFRSITHIDQTITLLSQGQNKLEAAFHFLHASLAVASISLFFFNPVLCFLTSSISDFIFHSRSLIEALRNKDFLAAAESLAFMTLDLLFFASVCYGAIKITIACMLLQIGIGGYLSLRHFQQKNYLEGVCQALATGLQVVQAIPQLKLFQWTRTHGSSFELELKQDQRGFVYLDVPDEKLHSLFEHFKKEGMREPPYFKKGMAGAHVSVILLEEMDQKILIDSIGKKFTFRISHFDVVEPTSSKKVYILSGANSELEALRVRHGLSPKIHGHDFHLTFGLSG